MVIKMSDELWEGDVVVLKETSDALLIDYENEEAWIPKSQIDEDSEVEGVGDEGVLVIPLWLATKKGLI